MVGNTVRFLGNPETLFYLLSNDCSPRKLYPRPLDYSTPARLYRYSDRNHYWEIEHWGTNRRLTWHGFLLQGPFLRPSLGFCSPDLQRLGDGLSVG